MYYPKITEYEYIQHKKTGAFATRFFVPIFFFYPQNFLMGCNKIIIFASHCFLVLNKVWQLGTGT